MWLFRRILKISLWAKITNETFLRSGNRKRELIDIINKRKIASLGHIMRNEKYQFLRLMKDGRIEGKRGIGRTKMSEFPNIRQWTEIHYIQTLKPWITIRRRRRWTHKFIYNLLFQFGICHIQLIVDIKTIFKD